MQIRLPNYNESFTFGKESEGEETRGQFPGLSSNSLLDKHGFAVKRFIFYFDQLSTLLETMKEKDNNNNNNFNEEGP